MSQIENIIYNTITRNSGYLARQEIEQILTKVKAKDIKRLEPYGFKVNSQGDEDGIIEEIFRRLHIGRGRFLEIGVENGLECNSLYLLHKGWRGYWIEGNEKQTEPILKKFRYLMENKRLGVAFSLVYPENINIFIEQLDFGGSEIDFLSIDIDGNDIYLLDALNAKPRVICIEYNSKFPANIAKKPEYSPTNFWRGGDYMGSSLLAINDVAAEKGYQLVGTNITGTNAFFVRKDLAGDLFPNGDCEALYNPPRYYLVFDHYQRVGHSADFGPYVDLLPPL